MEKFLDGTHYNVYFIGDEICTLEKPPLSNEHVDMKNLETPEDIKKYIVRWKTYYDIPFGHLDLVRETKTEKLFVVDPGTFPEFTNWKCQSDPVNKIGEILLEKYNSIKNS